MAGKFLDDTGLSYFWDKLKTWVSDHFLSLSGGTINGNVDVQGSLIAHASNIDRDGAAPSDTVYSPERIMIQDVDSESLSWMDSSQTAAGTITTRIVTANEYDGTFHSSTLNLSKTKTDTNNDGTMLWQGNSFIIRSSFIDRDGSVPSEIQNGPHIYFQDKDGETLGYLHTYRDTNGVSGLRMYGCNEVNGATSINGIVLSVGTDGTKGVGVSDVAAWRYMLGLGTSGALPITVGQGGTGATSAANARTNLAAAGTGVSNTFTDTQYIKSDNIDRDGSAPSSDAWGKYIGFNDKDGERIAYLGPVRYSSGIIGMGMYVYSENSSGNQVNNSIQVRIANDGTCTYAVGSPANFRSAIGADNASNLSTGTVPVARLTNVSWTYATGSASASFYVRWCKVANIVHVEVYGSKSMTSNTNTSLSTTVISSGNRPSKEVDGFLYSSRNAVGCLWVNTTGSVYGKILGYNASNIYGTISYPVI